MPGMRHLFNPRDLVPQSVMPAYPWLARTQLRTDDLPLHLERLRTLGVPYTQAMIENAHADAAGRQRPTPSALGAWPSVMATRPMSVISTAPKVRRRRWMRWWLICRCWDARPRSRMRRPEMRHDRP